MNAAFMQIVCSILVVLPITAMSKEGGSFTSFPKGQLNYLAAYDARHVLVGTTASQMNALQNELKGALTSQLQEMVLLEPHRLMVVVDQHVDWTKLQSKLRIQGFTIELWLGLRRHTGLVFFDNNIVLKARGALPRAALKRMNVACRPASYLINIYDCSTTETDVLSVVRKLHRMIEIDWAEPNFLKIMTLYDFPKDPLLEQQWHLNNADDIGHIQAFEAWQTTTGSRDTVIAIVDSGTDIGHPDIVGNYVGGFDGIDNDADPSPECGSQPDGQGPAASCPNSKPFRESHGTAVSGVAAAAGNIVFGAGVCPDCGIFAVRLIGDSGGLRSLSAAQTFQRINDAGVAVVNNSWGPSISQFFPLSQAEDESLTRLTTEGGRGLGAVVIFAAGNDYFQSADINPYATHPGVITVAASTNRDDFACYSNLGRSISVAGPSQGCFENEAGLLTADVRGPEGYSDLNFSRSFGGTSAAAPVVAGVAGLILSEAPQLSSEAVRVLIEDTADKIQTKTDWRPVVGIDLTDLMAYDKHGFSPFFGYGRVNAAAAVQAAAALDGNGLFADCGRDCGICENNQCLMACTSDSECLASQRCEATQDGDQVCRRPRRESGDIGAYCGPECEACATTLALDIREVSICTASCSDDQECPTGFDCRTIDEGAQICVPGSKTCGEDWSDRCQSRVRVGSGESSVCSCDCIEGATGDCPSAMVCANAYCTYRRGSIFCQPVDNPFEANDVSKCFPRSRSETNCTNHEDCSYGLYCLDGICDIDQDGCDTCAECVRQSDCGASSQCVNTARGRRCLKSCDSPDACSPGTHCAVLPTQGARFCINEDSDRKGICPRAWKCPLGDRCLLPSDCDADCNCDESNTCDCPEIPSDMSVSVDAGTLPTVDFPEAPSPSSDGCGCQSVQLPFPAFTILLFLGALVSRRKQT